MRFGLRTPTVRSLAMLLLVSSLTACGTRIAPATQVLLVVPSDAQLLDCVIVSPPDTEYALLLDPVAREELLIKDIRGRIGSQVQCNARWSELRRWKKDQLNNVPQP